MIGLVTFPILFPVYCKGGRSLWVPLTHRLAHF